jgi:hypothetical protein
VLLVRLRLAGGQARPCPGKAIDCRWSTAALSTLDAVEGESVIVRLSSREEDSHSTAGIVSIVGELKHETPARYEGHEFSIGSPYAERYPEHLAGGVLFIREETFESATLTTFDGNDYFILAIKTRALDILVQDGDSAAP